MFKKIIASLILSVSSAAMAETITLSKKNTVVFRGVVQPSTVTKAQADLLALHLSLPKGQPVYLFLDTPGGSIDSGMEFISFAKSLDREVKTVTAFAASMGFIMAQQLDERLVLPGGIFMSHRAHIGLEGQIPGEFNTRSDFFMKLITEEEKITAKRMGLNLKNYRELIRDEYWVFGKDAVKENAADRVVDVVCSPELLKSSHEEEVQVFIFRVKVTFSDCPLVRGPLSIEKPTNILAQLYPLEAEKVNLVIHQLFNNRIEFVKQYIVNNNYTKVFK